MTTQAKHIEVEHQQLQQDYRASKLNSRLSNRLALLFDNLATGIIILNEHGVIHESNSSAEELLGCALTGKTWLQVLQSRLAPRADDGHEVSLTNGKRLRIDTNSLAPEPGQLILLTDLTHTRELQTRLTQKQQLAKMGEMTAKMAHQIRTPLATASLYSEHLQSDQLSDDKRQQFAEKIGLCLQSIEQQISDMLLFSRGGNEQHVIVRVNSVMQRAIRMIEPQLRAADVELEVQNHANDRLIECNPESFIGALHNLIHNAIDAMQDDRRLLIKVLASDAHIDFIVQDYGVGMSDDIKTKALQPFFTNKTKGTGLGLSVVQAVASAHRGDVWIDSTLGHGCRIGLRLPQSEQQGESA